MLLDLPRPCQRPLAQGRLGGGAKRGTAVKAIGERLDRAVDEEAGHGRRCLAPQSGQVLLPLLGEQRAGRAAVEHRPQLPNQPVWHPRLPIGNQRRAHRLLHVFGGETRQVGAFGKSLPRLGPPGA